MTASLPQALFRGSNGKDYYELAADGYPRRHLTLVENPSKLVGYCGLYCGACGIHQGRIKQAAENLRRVIGAYGFDKMAPELAKWEPAFKCHPEFEKVLDGYVKLFGDCPGCVSGGGDPSCQVRECCRQKAYASCAECSEMDTCEKLKRYVPNMEEMRTIKTMGIDKWAERMQRKVDAGYCYLDKETK